jgi:hypothetical protein
MKNHVRLVNYAQIAVLDTNLLLMLVAGHTDPSVLGKGYGLKQYKTAHFLALCDFLNQFKQCVTTPHILGETSNLGKRVFGGEKLDQFTSHLKTITCTAPQEWQEIHIKLNQVEMRALQLFGLTDAALLALPQNHLIITDDGPLANFMAHAGRSTFRFIDLWDQIT